LPFQLMKVKTVFIWFADYHAFLPVFFAKLLNIQSIVVVGGYDATFIPELNYGAYSKGLRSLLTKKIVQWANWVIPVDDSLSDKITSRNGELKSVKTVYTGHDSEKWFCDTEKVNRIVTVGAFDNVSRLKIKGLDFFVEVAKRLPQYEFAIVRAMNNKGHLLGELPANLTLFTKRLSDEELRQLLSSSKIYAQFSLSEGLPSATCEAMLCECIPIGTNVGGIPNAIGKNGVVLEEREIAEAVVGIEKIMNGGFSGENCRTHIFNKFSIEHRHEALKQLIND